MRQGWSAFWRPAKSRWVLAVAVRDGTWRQKVIPRGGHRRVAVLAPPLSDWRAAA